MHCLGYKSDQGAFILRKACIPKKKLIVVLADVIDLMGTIFLAFFMEFIDKYKQERIQRQNKAIEI